MENWTVNIRHGITGKEEKNKKMYRKAAEKELKIKRSPLVLELKPFRSWAKIKDSACREFQSLDVLENELLT